MGKLEGVQMEERKKKEQGGMRYFMSLCAVRYGRDGPERQKRWTE